MSTPIATHFVDVPDTSALDEWLARPGIAVLFLHAPGCFVSRWAADEVERIGGEVALLDVEAIPEFAAQVERRTGVRHESPQVIVLRDGWPAWATSHFDLSAEAIGEAVERASPTGTVWA